VLSRVNVAESQLPADLGTRKHKRIPCILPFDYVLLWRCHWPLPSNWKALRIYYERAKSRSRELEIHMIS
jgi:hypothetical protein